MGNVFGVSERTTNLIFRVCIRLDMLKGEVIVQCPLCSIACDEYKVVDVSYTVSLEHDP
jgi:hypothetical protein